MDYFFVSHSKVRRYGKNLLPGVDLDVEAYVQRRGALKEGTPFFLGSDMRPVEPLCSFFFEMAKTLKAKSLADYTYDVLDVVDFLEDLEVPTDLLSATEEDLVAYRDDRTQYQDEPVSPGTWQRRRALINNFYDWAVDGQANTARGAERFVNEVAGRVRRAGAAGPLTMRADSGFWSAKVLAACRRHRIRYSVTVRQTKTVTQAIAHIPEDD